MKKELLQLIKNIGRNTGKSRSKKGSDPATTKYSIG